MGEYDIYLDGKGYMLAKDQRGNLVSGAAREQVVDPFTRQLSLDEPYKRAPFRFNEGSGLRDYDGSGRYEWGNVIDARSGRLQLAPKRTITTVDYDPGSFPHNRKITADSELSPIVLKDGTQEGVAQRYVTPSDSTTIRSVALLVRRNPGENYATSVPFYVGICTNTTGPKPLEPAVEYVTKGMKVEGGLHVFPDRWRNGDYFWLEAAFDNDAVIGSSTAFWITITNPNNDVEEIQIAEDVTAGTVATRSVHNGTSWSNGVSDYPLMIKVGYKDGTSQVDSFVRCFQLFRGSSNIEKLYMGTGFRILCWDPTWAAGHWWEDKTVDDEVLQLVEFNSKLFAACTENTDFWWSTGAGNGSPDWTQVTGQQATAFAVHDGLLWKARFAHVKASADGTGWASNPVVVGDPGTPIVRGLVSHGGKLLAIKSEGLFEISYPDTYPASGTPTCNMVLDFSTERCKRQWVLDWHSGLYFPGMSGVYEYKAGVLRNLWEDKIDENAIWDINKPIPTFEGEYQKFTRPRGWAPLFDHGPVAWTAACGTTRGILFARSNPHTETSDLIWYDGRNWYSLRASGAVGSDGTPDAFGEYITALFVQDVGGGRGWMWFSEGYGVARTEWPTWTDDTNDDGSVDFPQYGVCTTPYFSLGESSKEMLLCKVGLVTWGLSTTRKVAVYYRCDDTGAWTSLGTLTTSPYQELTFSTGTTARRVQFKLELNNGGTDYLTSVLVEQMDLFYQTVPEPSKTCQLLIDCSASQALHEGGVDERATSEIIADLKALLGASSFTYTDLLGTDRVARVAAITIQPTVLQAGPGPGGRTVTAQAVVTLLEV